MHALILLLTLLPLVAHAHEKNAAIHTSSEAVTWCKERSEKQLRKQKKTPYNWSASWWTEVNTLRVEGEWSVDNRPIRVTCQIETGAARSSMTMAINDKRHP
ncbi:MAG: hypothetical protein AB1810_00630 [Pseudomonadota bacterium]